jgi:hypothetical protein
VYKRADRKRPHPDDLTAEELTESFNRHIAKTLRHQAAATGPTRGKMDLNSGEELQQHHAPQITSSVGVADLFDEAEPYRICTRCGSALYRRSRRRWLERVLNRPKMARCLKCGNRFPYPQGD